MCVDVATSSATFGPKLADHFSSADFFGRFSQRGDNSCYGESIFTGTKHWDMGSDIRNTMRSRLLLGEVLKRLEDSSTDCSALLLDHRSASSSQVLGVCAGHLLGFLGEAYLVAMGRFVCVDVSTSSATFGPKLADHFSFHPRRKYLSKNSLHILAATAAGKTNLTTALKDTTRFAAPLAWPP